MGIFPSCFACDHRKIINMWCIYLIQRKIIFFKYIKGNQNTQIILEKIQGRNLDLEILKVNLFSWRCFTMKTFSDQKFTYME